MGLFDRLFGGRFTAPPPDETDISDAEILRELHPRPSPDQRKAMKGLLGHLLARMPEDECQRLARRIDRLFTAQDAAYNAISSGLLDRTRGQKLQYLAMLSVDWRGFDGFEYLAPIAVKASGITEAFAYRHTDNLPMSGVLRRFDVWLAEHGRRYLQVDSGSDSYEGFIVDANRVQEITRLAEEAGLRVSLESF